jgi:hypothetical protein
MIYSVTFEAMPTLISVVVERTISVDVDPAGDVWTQIDRAVRQISDKAKVTHYFRDEDDDDLIGFVDYLC